MKKIGVIVEARLGSTRLPGKIMKKINNKPLLFYMIERLKLIKNIDDIVIATTNSKNDDLIYEFSKSQNVNCFRGSENNVMHRVIKCAEKFKIHHIVEITGDDPLIDPDISSKVIKKYIKNCIQNLICANDFYKQVPLGLYTRVFSLNTIKKIYKKSNIFNREHVESYFYQNPFEFYFIHTHRYFKFSNREDIRLTVDTIEDFNVIKKIINHFKNKNDFKLSEIIHFFDKNPSIKNINNKIKQNVIS